MSERKYIRVTSVVHGLVCDGCGRVGPMATRLATADAEARRNDWNLSENETRCDKCIARKVRVGRAGMRAVRAS